jgi:hypothetical protein
VGVLFDYFRASSPDEARNLALLPGGPLGSGPRLSTGADGVSAKGMDPVVVMGRLLALILDVEWSTRLVRPVDVWPPGPRPQRGDHIPDDSPWATGPWVSDLGREFRDGFADVDDFNLPWISDKWWPIEELPGVGDAMWALNTAEEFVALARRAQDSYQSIYCWACL